MIVRLTGGLCNQMFMYAFGRGLSTFRQEELKFFWSRSTWDYALDAYHTRVDLVNSPYSPPSAYNEKTFAFDEDALNQGPNTYYLGYWQTEKYFEDVALSLREELRLKQIRPEIELIAGKLRQWNSVFIHVRRGDYVNPGTAAYHGNLGHALTDDGYYGRAIKYIEKSVPDAEFFIFSDDPKWCEENFSYQVVSNSGLSQHEDLYLMSSCKHGIGANSTFSWWANWLGERPDRICVAPKKWFNVYADTRDIIPDRWVRL